MTDEIIIDGVIHNICNGCSLYDGNVCTGAKTYEDNAERDRHICDEHLASQFWVVFKQLKRAYKQMRHEQQQLNQYKQALDEIEINISKYQELTFDKPRTMQENDCIYNILSIINRAKEQ